MRRQHLGEKELEGLFREAGRADATVQRFQGKDRFNNIQGYDLGSIWHKGARLDYVRPSRLREPYIGCLVYNALTVEKILTRHPDIRSIRDFGKLFGNPFKDCFFTTGRSTRRKPAPLLNRI
ncbi:MAG: hypothetical protein A3G81_07830 [Betaproteobacteria bacterium RIFCSPLOWO2_12_FULL_65_14]|nr:MAG: hypothetical protein A3G81_07830 [Betaproteobacteria bacterium RIFCSPLOWO2_12_FULL_65_14]